MVFGWQKGKCGDYRKLNHSLKNIPILALVFFYMYLYASPHINLSAFLFLPDSVGVFTSHCAG